jgi:PAS domain S-box-containing protein
MARKPTYKELEQRIRDLEEESVKAKRAEEALHESEQKFRRLFEDDLTGDCITTGDGIILECNPAFLRIFRYKNKVEAVGESITVLYPEPSERGSILDKLRATGKLENYETIRKRKDGSLITVIENIVATFDEGGKLIEVKAYIYDITDRKRAEEALRKISEKTKLFAYSVAHDLKSPVIGIYGLIKRLHQVYADVLGDKGKTYCDQILKAAEHLSELVAQINAYIATGTAPLIIETVKLKGILQMVREEFSGQLVIRQIKWSEPEHLPELNADRIAILRVFGNLVENALKYGGDHLTEIRLDYKDGDGFHILSVSNDGTLIRQKYLERLFEPFQRDETARGVEGAGLGLAIVKELVERHGGEVWVESAQEKWTTFHVSISKNL